MPNLSETLQQLISLSHDLGSSPAQWAILGEGNTSARVDESTFLVKASGSQLATLTEKNLVEVKFAPLWEALDSDSLLSDTEIKTLLMESRVDPEALTPSVETLFHADLLRNPGVQVIGHTHIISINGLLCSDVGWELMKQGGRLFPDEIVVCGVAPCCVPYVDPGLPLARCIRDKVREFIARHGAVPRTIYLQNHEFIALGATAREVLNITQMADKAAHILLGAIACGSPRFLTPKDVARIASRPDEHLRQRALGLQTTQ